MQEMQAYIYGRVQRVMFRDFVQRKARGLGITGTVQNMDDGSVQVCAYGEKEKLKTLLSKLHKGSLLARVDDVKVTWKEMSEVTFTDFTIVFNNNFIDRI